MSEPSEGNFFRVLQEILLIIVMLIVPVIAQAQSVATTKREPTKLPAPSGTVSASVTASESSGANVEDRLRALEEELRQQSRTLSEMREIIANQQRVITELAARTSTIEGPTNNSKELASVSTTEVRPSAAENQTPSIDDRL